MKNWFLLILATLVFAKIDAQELNVTVDIQTPKLQTVDPKVFETLEQTMKEFLNNQKWTKDEFEQEERIDLNIVMTITAEINPTTFNAELLLQSTRPVFGSTYETPLFKHLDKQLTFTYQQYQPLEYSQTSYINELSSVLAFYANIVIGFDYDSFSPFGGDPYFQKAQDIINQVPPGIASSVKGWLPKDGNRSRYWLAENLLTSRVRPFRQAFYDYHRQGLDLMHENAAAGRAVMTQALSTLLDVNRTYPNSMILQVFTNTKASEIIEIYKGAPPAEKSEVVKVMVKVDPTKASNYRQGIGR
ncbi:MAG TPA: DUF4835 family protein [Bacteroidetes bacterium]|nr:DUF4835 family protein [Bacteroidota bacterium]